MISTVHDWFVEMKVHKSTEEYNIINEYTAKQNAFVMEHAMPYSYKDEDYKFYHKLN